MEKRYELAGKVYSASMLAAEIGESCDRVLFYCRDGSPLPADAQLNQFRVLAEVIKQHADKAGELLTSVYNDL